MSDCQWSSGDFYAETFPTARKQYECCECTAPIEKGELHLRAAGKSDGTMWHERQHMLCRELCMLIGPEMDDGCFGFGELRYMWDQADYGRQAYKRDEHYREARTLFARIIKRERRQRTVPA